MWTHRLANVDTEARTAECLNCGPVTVRVRHQFPGKPVVWRCNEADRGAWRRQRKPYRKYVADACSRCGFEAEHPCQLDVHHLDGNHGNNDPDNLDTLCANCHRMTHHLLRQA